MVDHAPAATGAVRERFDDTSGWPPLPDERELARSLAREWGLPYVDAVRPAQAAAWLLGVDDATRLGAVPVGGDGETVHVVVAEPTEERLDEVRRRLGGQVAFGVVTPRTLQALLAADDPAPDEAPPAADALAAVLAQATGRVLSIRADLERLAAELAERERRIAHAEAELADVLAAREQARARESALRIEIERRDVQLARVRATLTEILGTLGSRRLA